MRLLYCLPMVESFSQISSNPQIQAKLQELYGNVNNIDLFVGALAEDLLPGTSIGPLINAIAGNQFTRLRDGDRFFYTQDAFLQSDAIQQILNFDTVSLANIIRWNTGITTIQDNVFFDKAVLVVEAPAAGGNFLVFTTPGVVVVVNAHTGQTLATAPLTDIRQVILVGSHTAADVFNLFFVASGGIEGGFVIYGGHSAGDRLNVFGRPLRTDTFSVTDSTFSTSRTDSFFTPFVQTVAGRRGKRSRAEGSRSTATLLNRRGSRRPVSSRWAATTRSPTPPTWRAW